MNVTLVVVGGESKTPEIKIKLPAILGRGREATVMLGHSLVSRQHCRIYEQGGKVLVKDMGSLNGTFVNNERIEGEAELPPGQLLTVGTVTFRAVYGAEAAQAAAALTPPTAAGKPAKQSAETVRGPVGPTVRVKPGAKIPPSAAPQAAEEDPLDFLSAAAGGELAAGTADDEPGFFINTSSEPLAPAAPSAKAAAKAAGKAAAGSEKQAKGKSDQKASAAPATNSPAPSPAQAPAEDTGEDDFLKMFEAVDEGPGADGGMGAEAFATPEGEAGEDVDLSWMAGEEASPEAAGDAPQPEPTAAPLSPTISLDRPLRTAAAEPPSVATEMWQESPLVPAAAAPPISPPAASQKPPSTPPQVAAETAQPAPVVPAAVWSDGSDIAEVIEDIEEFQVIEDGPSVAPPPAVTPESHPPTITAMKSEATISFEQPVKAAAPVAAKAAPPAAPPVKTAAPAPAPAPAGKDAAKPAPSVAATAQKSAPTPSNAPPPAAAPGTESFPFIPAEEGEEAAGGEVADQDLAAFFRNLQG